MLECKLKRQTGGSNETSWIQPTCACGWEGRREYAYEDYQYSNVREQESEHIAAMIRKTS
jgi:hypothetical protein